MTKLKFPVFEVDECIGPNLNHTSNHFHSGVYEIYYLTKGNIGYFVDEKNLQRNRR